MSHYAATCVIMQSHFQHMVTCVITQSLESGCSWGCNPRLCAQPQAQQTATARVNVRSNQSALAALLVILFGSL